MPERDEDLPDIQDIVDARDNQDSSSSNNKFTMVSNIMKKMHDVIKTAINNTR